MSSYRASVKEDYMKLVLADVCGAASAVSEVAPFQGIIRKAYWATSAAVSADSAAVTLEINGEAVTALAITLGTSKTADTAYTIHNINVNVREGDVVSLITDGLGTGTLVNLSLTLIIEVFRGPLPSEFEIA